MTTGQKIGLGVGVVAAGAVVAVLLLKGPGDDDKGLLLDGSTGSCVLKAATSDGKDVHVGNNGKMTYTIENKCNSDQLVLVGNFRTTLNDPANVMDCKAGIIESVWPFKNLDDQARRQIYVPAGGTEKLTLKEAKNTGSSQVSYWFDVCMAGKKVDPRLDIDP